MLLINFISECRIRFTGVNKKTEKLRKLRKLKKPNHEKKPIKSIKILKKPSGSVSVL
jgi:hypothetical protein